MYNGYKVVALIPAAGLGQRMGIGTKKQYLKLRGKEILNWTLIHTIADSIIDEVIIIAPKEDVDELAGKVKKWIKDEGKMLEIRVVEGGETRQKSVYHGLSVIEQSGVANTYVVIHDGVRPFFPKNKLNDFLEILANHHEVDGVIAGAEVTDTLKTIDANHVITGTVDRSLVWTVQTPQVFNLVPLIEAHRYANMHLLKVTDDAALLEATGKNTMIVPCPSENIKITRPIDLIVAESLFERYRADI